MRGRMRALEDRGRRLGPIDEEHGGTTLANSSTAFAKVYSTEYMIKYWILKDIIS